MTAMSTVQVLTEKPFGLFFQALANPTRMKIVMLLKDMKRGSKVSEICEDLGLEQTHASHALRCLAFCGLVSGSRQGKSVVYEVNHETVAPILKIVERHLEKYAPNLCSCDSLER